MNGEGHPWANLFLGMSEFLKQASMQAATIVFAVLLVLHPTWEAKYLYSNKVNAFIQSYTVYNAL